MSEFTEMFEDAFADMNVDDLLGVDATWHFNDGSTADRSVTITIIEDAVVIDRDDDGKYEEKMAKVGVSSDATTGVPSPDPTHQVTFYSEKWDVDTVKTKDGRKECVVRRRSRLQLSDQNRLRRSR